MFGPIVTAMLTPFTKDGAVDYAEAVRIANHLADTGSTGILISGTTGESPTLTHEEEQQLFVEIKRGLGKKATVMAGTGSNCTKTAVEATQKAEKLGVDSALIVVPYYNKPTQEGLYQHFSAVAKATSLPLMIYNIPGRTSRNMEPETIARIVENNKNYVAIKEASGDLKQMQAIRDITPKSFTLYSGDDGLTLDLLKIGGVGVVSVASHLVGVRIKEMITAFNAGDVAKAEAINKELEDIFKVIFITTNPAPIKAAMNMLGFNCGIPRLPLVDLNAEEKATLRAVLLKHKLVK